MAVSTICLAGLVSSSVWLAAAGGWQWLPAFYGAAASFIPGTLLSGVEVLQRHRAPKTLPPGMPRKSALASFAGIILVTAVFGYLYNEALTTPRGSASDQSAQLSNDTWTWAGSSWRLQSPSHRPPARESANLAFDKQKNLVVLFGGIDHRDTWTWDGRDWAERRTAARPDLSVGSIVYDSQLQGIVFVDESARLWSLDGSGWQEISRTGGPKAAAYTGATGTAVYAGYDEKLDELVVLTDTWRTRESTSAMETWTWDGVEWRLAASEVDAFFEGPDPAGSSNLIYDPDSGQLISIGRHRTWTWDGVRWTPQDQPFVGSGGGAYDSLRHQLVYLFRNSPATTWLWDGRGWSSSASVVQWTGQDVAVAFDVTHGVVVLFG
ncbi:MAG TPA: hypothetical protein VLK30_08930, partial [Candidatus Limnocylindrales bacterium]|nr:hypothetical protein [Candidatus Limnocylindrales bacterium]